MINIYKSFGIERLEEPSYSDKLRQNILDNIRYVIPGYGCDYYLRTFPGEIEFELCKSLDGTILGTDIHFSGHDLLNLKFDEIISNDGTAHFYAMHSDRYQETFPVRIVCPDVLSCPQAGDSIYGQIVAFSGENLQTISSKEARESYIRDKGHGNVELAGSISSVDEYSFEFEDISAEYYELEVETPIGRVAVIVSKSKIGTPSVEDFISCEALLSFDVAIYPDTFEKAPFMKRCYAKAPFDSEYRLGDGYVPNMKNAEKVLANCIETNNYLRFGRACSDSILLHVNGNETNIGNESLGAELSAHISKPAKSCEIKHILSSSFETLLGWNAIILSKASDSCIAVSIGINEYGFVDEIWILDSPSNSFGIDEELHALAMLKYGMCSCKATILREHLAEKCTYRSEYADRMSIGAQRIIDRLNEVAGNLDETNQYTCHIIPSHEALSSSQENIPDIYKGHWCAIAKQADTLAAVIFIQLNEMGKISNVLLSRNGNYLKAFETEGSSEAIKGIEPTNIQELLESFYGKEDTPKLMRDNDTPDDNEVYVWKEADAYAVSWLKNQGYVVTDTIIEEDCIGYACSRKGKDVVVYVYAYGKQRSIQLDADYCQKLKTYPMSANRMIIIAYLKVDAVSDETGNKTYKVGHYSSPEDAPDMWILKEINGRNIILYYPRAEIFSIIPRLMAAYNTQNLDLLKALCTKDVSIENFTGGRGLNDGFYSNLSYHFEHYGKMRLAYVRYNDIVFSAVPYLENYCYLSFRVSNDTDKICSIKENPLDGNFRELLITDESPETDPQNDYPQIKEFETLPSDSIARFAVKLIFENGEVRRYDFKAAKPQIIDENETTSEYPEESEEIGNIDYFGFTDKMFAHGKLMEHIDLPSWMGYRNYPQRGQGISFVNGYAISTAELYFNSYPIEQFSYAGMDEVHVSQFDYAKDGFGVGHISNLDPQNPLYLLDRNTMTAKALPGEYQNTSICIVPFCGGYSEGLVMVSTLNDIDLQYHHNLSGCAGMWGWLDKSLQIMIQPKYIFAKNFEGGRAVVCKGEWSINEDNRYWCENEMWGVIDQEENEIVPCQFDELYEIDGTDRLYFVHEGGWDDGHYSIYDCKERKIILVLDFNFDMGYMFNECFVTENDVLVFDEHLPGKGKDLITAFDLHERKYIVHQEENTERTYNGEKTLTVKNEQTGMDIIVF